MELIRTRPLTIDPQMTKYPIEVLTLSWHYEICVKEFEEKCVKKMILSERSESIIFNIFTKNFSKFRTSLDLFFGSFLLYQDKRNEHNRWGQPQRGRKKQQIKNYSVRILTFSLLHFFCIKTKETNMNWWNKNE